MVFCLTRRQLVFLGIVCLSAVCLAFIPQVVFAVGVGEGITKVVNAVVGGLMKGLEWILGLFQFLFLQVIEFTILDFAKNWNEGGFLSDFRVVWQVLRDFVNLIIIVFFIVTAMMTSLGEGQFGFHRKALLYLILAAVFVNFSAFFTLLIIDISHILFMLFFNALDASSWGSFSPFSGYSVVLGDVSTGMFNIIFGLIAIVVNWFIVLGILYFCIILIERYIIAMFLVLLSPLAALGFFASMSGGNPLASKFIGVYTWWKERLGYIFSMPVVLILGFTLLLVLFRGALGELVDPENFVKLIGVSTSEGRSILLRLIMASIVLILGIFKVGEAAKSANIPAIAGKFKFGEIASKLVGPKAQLGVFKSLRNPASRGLGNYKQKIYNKRDKWRREGSVLAKIPGVGKELDIGGKVRRARQTARAVASGVDAVSGGASARDVSFQSAEASEDKRVWSVIRTGSLDEKKNLLKQALDPKSKVVLNEQQTAELAQNSDLHPLLSSLTKGVSQGTFRQIYKDTQRLGKEIALRQGQSIEEGALPHDYLAKEHTRDAAAADFKQVEASYLDLKRQKDLVQGGHDAMLADLKQQKDAAQGEHAMAESRFKQTDVYKAFEREVRHKEGTIRNHDDSGNTHQSEAVKKSLEKFKADFYSTTAVANPVYLDLEKKQAALKRAEDALQEAGKNKPAALQGIEDELQAVGAKKSEVDAAKKRAEADFAAAENKYKRVVQKKEEKDIADKKEVASVLSSIATNTAAGSVSGSAAKQFSSDELDEARKKREAIVAPIQETFATMKDDYAQSSNVLKEMLEKQQNDLDEQGVKENADLAKKKSAYYEERAQNPNPNTLTPSMQQLQKEIDVLEKAATDRRARSLEIDEKKNRIGQIRRSFEEKDATDARKIEILGKSTSHAASFMRGGTDYLTDQLQTVTQKIDAIEKSASGINADNRDEYSTLQKEQSQVEERLKRVSEIGHNVESVIGALDEQKEILDSSEYKKASDQERYLAMFGADTLLRDVTSARDRRKKEFEEEYRNKQKEKNDKKGDAEKKEKIDPPKNAYKEDAAWKTLDEQKKNLEKIQKEGGASPALREEAAKKSAKKKSAKKK